MRRLALSAAGILALTLCASAQTVTILDTGGFEGYALGPIVGQNGWVDGAGFGQPLNPALIGVGPGTYGHALEFNNVGGATAPHTESPVQVSFANLTGTYRYVTATFDFYRDGNGLYNNLWWWPVGNNPWSGLQWDNAASPTPGAQILPVRFASSGPSPSILMPQSQWVHVALTFDLTLGRETAYVNGALVTSDFNIGTGEFSGWFFDDTNTIDPARSPNGVGQQAWVDNLLIVATVPEPSAVALLGLGFCLLLRARRRG